MWVVGRLVGWRRVRLRMVWLTLLERDAILYSSDSGFHHGTDKRTGSDMLTKPAMIMELIILIIEFDNK